MFSIADHDVEIVAALLGLVKFLRVICRVEKASFGEPL
jgi:hypothetical protein